MDADAESGRGDVVGFELEAAQVEGNAGPEA
jgi:hypothetical protein